MRMQRVLTWPGFRNGGQLTLRPVLLRVFQSAPDNSASLYPLAMHLRASCSELRKLKPPSFCGKVVREPPIAVFACAREHLRIEAYKP